MATEKFHLLLVGGKGSGKSATGNSILGRDDFLPRNDSSRQSVEELGELVKNGMTMRVVDTSGYGYIGSKIPDNAESMITRFEFGLNLLRNKVTALLFLLRYNDPFIQPEKNSMKLIKNIFGPNVMSNYGIIVMTWGDIFEATMRDSITTFEEWCGGQEGEIQSILHECNQICVLLNNKTKDPDKLKEQYEKLMIKVKEIKSSIRPYSYDDFVNAKWGRTKLLVMSKLPDLEQQTNNFLSKFHEKMANHFKMYDCDPNRMRGLKNLKVLLEEIVIFRHNLMDEDKGTGLIQIYNFGVILNIEVDYIRRHIAHLESSMGQINSISN